MSLFALLLSTSFLVSFIPAVILLHRIGVMVHEYIHGIPFRRYRNNLRVLALIDGLTLSFGLFEFFRVTHLHHHRWLNSPGDSTFDNAQAAAARRRVAAALGKAKTHLWEYAQALLGKHTYVRADQTIFGAVGSIFWIGVWLMIDRPDVILKLVIFTTFTSVAPVSLRRTVEHYAEPGNPGFANEYQVLIPLFNINRHIHHHENPRVPWYALQYRTPALLPWHAYISYWFRAHVRGDLVLMRPMAPVAASTEATPRMDNSAHALHHTPRSSDN